jgi:hypothetical protein
MQTDERKITTWTYGSSKENDALHRDLCTKPTDHNTLLCVDSMHPLPLMNGLTYSQVCRVKQNKDFDSNAKKNYRYIKNERLQGQLLMLQL